jgi:hypothetical protein
MASNQELTNEQFDYVDSFIEPAEFDFLTADQKKSLEAEAKKLDKSIKHYKVVFGDTNWTEQIDKDILQGDVYTVQQALVVAEKQKARNWYGERIGIDKSLVSPTGQRVIMSIRCSDSLDLNMDGYITKDSLGQLVQILKEEGVNAESIEKVKSAADKYGVIILQNGIFAVLKPMLEDFLDRRTSVSKTAPDNSEVAVPAPRPTPIPPAPVRKTEPAKPATDFDKKLEAVGTASQGSSVGRDLEAMRRQMANAKTQLGSPPVGEMSSPTLRKVEQDREGELKPTSPSQVPEAPSLGAPRNPLPRGEGKSEEIKREVAAQELPAHKQQIASSSRPVGTPRKDEKSAAPKPVAPKPFVSPSPSPDRSNAQESKGKSLDQINIIDDLKKIDLQSLRQGPAATQTQTIKAKILHLARANKLLPYYTVIAFEESPLFKAYLQVGSAMIGDSNPDRKDAFKNAAFKAGSQLTQQEFEAIADLKKEIEGL